MGSAGGWLLALVVAAAAPVCMGMRAPVDIHGASMLETEAQRGAFDVGVGAKLFLLGLDELELAVCSKCEWDEEVVDECALDHDTVCRKIRSTGCANEQARTVTPYFTAERNDVALCQGSFASRIYDDAAQGLCADGWHVCTGRDVYDLGLPNAAADQPSDKCFAYDSAVDCNACFETCASSTSVNGVGGCYDANTPDVPGVGGKCNPEGNAPACWHSNGPRRKAKDQSDKCFINSHAHNVHGVLCCKDKPTGCAENGPRVVTPHFTKERDDVALCEGDFHGEIGGPPARALCARDWHVCTGREVWALSLPNAANDQPSDKCFAFDAATDCNGCFETCKGSKSVNGANGCYDANTPDIPGVGGKCGVTGQSKTCWTNSGSRRDAISQSDKCNVNTASHNVHGVLCCKGGPSGCARNQERVTTDVFTADRRDVALCKGNFHGHIAGNGAQAVCGLGWHVCTGKEVYRLDLPSSAANQPAGMCFAFDAATDCHACFETCESSVSVNGVAGCYDAATPDIPGVGGKCRLTGSTATTCWHTQGARRDALSQSNKCHLSTGADNVNGVLCCMDSGCANNNPRVVTPHFTNDLADVALCEGSFNAAIGDDAASALCAEGWRVCTGTDVYGLDLPTAATEQPSDKCFAFDAAADCNGCFETCKGSTSVNGRGCYDANTPDIPGIGGKCKVTGSGATCWHTDGSRRDAILQSDKCHVNTAQHNINGVLCCRQ